MQRGFVKPYIIPHHDDDDDAERKATKRPKLVPYLTRPSPLVPFLPEELIAQILLRLPARNLVQLKRVCNSWRILISSSQFAKDHLQYSIALNPLLVYFHQDYHKIGILPMQSLLENPNVPTKAVCLAKEQGEYIRGSCNGLMCLIEPNWGTRHSRARLWNPCTGLASEWLEIGGHIGVHGFGYDHVHDTYKLFANVSLQSGETAAKIFTFGKNSSRTIQDFPSRIRAINYMTATFVSGTLNWLAPLAPEDHLVRGIVSLDLENETYGHLSLPGDYRIIPVLSALSDCLAVCFGHDDDAHWVVWLMKEYGVHQSWTKLAIIPHMSEQLYPLDPLYISDNGILFATMGLDLVRHNLNDGSTDFSMTDMSIDKSFHNPRSEFKSCRSFHIYQESLISP